MGSISGYAKQKTADLVLVHGKIATMDESKPKAQALAIKGSTILAVGSNQEIRAYIDKKTGLIDLKRLTRREALRTYTLNAAYAAFEEDIKGSLTPGKLADIVVLSRDLLTVPEDQILATKVELTILDGKVVYQRN